MRFLRFPAATLFVALWALIASPARAEIAIQEVVSPGGITAWLVEEHSIPFTAMQLRFTGGSALDPAGKRGATAMMTYLLEEGAAGMDSRAFAAAAESLAASYRFDIYSDALTISAQFLTENRDAAVDLLHTAMTETRFDQEALDRVRGQVLSNLRSDLADPGSIASRAFDRLTWGDHPYGSDQDGTPETVAALTREDLVAAQKAVMARDRLFVGVVGDITAEDLGPMLDRLLGDLPATGAPMPVRATYQLKPGVTVIDYDSPQSIAIFGQEGLALDDPDYFTAMVLNEAVGGGSFASRLMNEVREKRGLTYGIGTYLQPMDLGKLLVGQFASANGKMSEALDVVRQVWADIAANGLTEAELQDTKTYLTGAYPLRFDGNATIARIITGMQAQGLPINYAATRNDKVEAVTMEDVKRVAKRLFRPEDLGIVVVGKPDGVVSTP
jgi:zinc protease